MKKCVKILFIGFLFAGCVGSSQSPIAVKQFALEYPYPRFESLARIEHVIRVERFTAAQAFHNNDILYRQKPYMRSAYIYHRWNITPSDMMTELLLRDIRAARIFGAVLSHQEGGDARFLLEGQIEEFMEIDEGEKTWASLIVHVTFSDLSGKTSGNRIVFQNTYKFAEPFKERQPHELARAMSSAVEKLSKELILDIYRIAKGSI